jgi:hypothetical protein
MYSSLRPSRPSLAAAEPTEASHDGNFDSECRAATDRAHVVATQVWQIFSTALSDFLRGYPPSRDEVHAEIAAVLRDEFNDVQQATINEIRTLCD